MKRIVLSVVAVMLLSACEVMVEPYHNGYSYHNQHGYCDDSEPYYHSPIEEEFHYDYHTGYYEGICSVWLVDVRHGRYEYEEWCLWENMCRWEYISSYANYNHSH
jgi:hypothetical protein